MILFDKIVFGPIKSRRFGASLGINLLPLDSKMCNFNCIYCECGWTNLKEAHKHFYPAAEVVAEIDRTLEIQSGKKARIDCITFAGNGEPTMHPEFKDILAGTIRARNRYYPKSKIVVLSNAALLANKSVVEALRMADLRIMKLDAGTEEVFKQINKPLSRLTLARIVEQLRQFKGDLYIQTLFLKAYVDNKLVDNTTDAEVAAWIDLLKQINPKHVMIYTVDRETPLESVKKINPSELEDICRRVRAAGISAGVYI